MSGVNLVIDTNIISYLLDGNKRVAKILQGREIRISFISELEIQAREGLNEVEHKKIELFLSQCIITDITPSIKKLTLGLRRKFNLRLPDAIIAATALDANLPLFTADQQFQKISVLNTVIFYP